VQGGVRLRGLDHPAHGLGAKNCLTDMGKHSTFSSIIFIRRRSRVLYAVLLPHVLCDVSGHMTGADVLVFLML
jgi:hypothetical protein